MANTRVFETTFLGLSAIGFTLLWPMMVYNGTLVALIRAAWTGTFADGRPLRTSYFHFFPADFATSVLVAFFDDQIDGRDNGAWLFMLDFQALLQTTALWVLVEGSRKGETAPSLKRFWLWPLLWNLFGAAIIYPLYFYYHTRDSTAGKSNPAIATTRARALIPNSVLMGFIPALAMMYGYRFATASSSQGITAAYQFSPLLVAAVVNYATPSDSKISRANSIDSEGNLVRYSYILTGLVSGSVHLYTWISTLVSSDETLSFSRIFVPIFSSVKPGSAENLHQGALLFLQYDWIVVNISCALWICLFKHKGELFPSLEGGALLVPFVLFVTFLLGPGAAVCGALWLREGNLRLQHSKLHRN